MSATASNIEGTIYHAIDGSAEGVSSFPLSSGSSGVVSSGIS